MKIGLILGGLLLATVAGSAYWIEKQEAMRDVNKLRKTFAKHDLDELTLAKPDLMEGKINRASKRVLENLEKLTDPNQFDEKDSNNS